MRIGQTIRIAGKGLVLIVPLTALATSQAQAADEPQEKTSDIEQTWEIGAHMLDDDAWRFGKYTGVTEEGAELVLDLNIERKLDPTSDDTSHWRLDGQRLGLDSQRLGFEYKKQGAWSLDAEYREIPNYRFDDGLTPFSGAGTSMLQLPADWVTVTGGDTSSFAALGDSLVPFNSQWKRKRLELAYNHKFDRNWNFDLSWRHETKDGENILGGSFGTQGLNPRAVVLPSPIDWETDIMEAHFGFGNARYQLGAAVYASWFTNDEPSLTWQNPYGARNSWSWRAGYPGGNGLQALDPDNQAMQFRIYGGFNLTPVSRLSADVAFGTMEQDERLFDYSVNQGLMVHTPLPADSANAEIDTTHANVRFTTRLFGKVGLTANYTLDERDNNTPRHTWVYIAGDSEDQKPYEEGRINLPYSFEKEQWDLTATWRAARGLRLKGGVERTDYQRTYAEVTDSDETRLFAGINIGSWSKASLSFDFADSDRNADAYIGNRPYIAYRVPGSVDDDDFDNLPALRKYDQTDRERREYRVRADFFPVDMFNLGVTGASYDDDYDDPDGLFGLQSSEVTSWSLDAGLHPSQRISLVGYYTRESYDTVQTGRMWSNKVQAENPANDWQASVSDEVETWNLSLQLAGAEGEDSRMSDRLKLGFDLTRSHVESDVAVSGATNIATAPLPTLRSEMNSWSLWGSFAINERTSIRLSYEQQELETDDFAFDDVPIDGSPSVLLMGQAAPNYDVSLLMLYLAYRY